ncbi:unnamed protein product [Lampetra planeri]
MGRGGLRFLGPHASGREHSKQLLPVPAAAPSRTLPLRKTLLLLPLLLRQYPCRELDARNSPKRSGSQRVGRRHQRWASEAEWASHVTRGAVMQKQVDADKS